MGSGESRVPTSTRTQVLAPTLLDRNSSKHLRLRDEEQPQAAPEVERPASQSQVGESWKYSPLLDEQPEGRDEPERNEKDIIASLGWFKTVKPYKMDVAVCQFNLLKAVELRTSSMSQLRLHASADNDKMWHLRLTDTDRILGFRFHEVQDVTGATRQYNPHVLLQNGTSLEVTLEPLSGHIFWPEPDYPGRIQWMPLSAKPTADQRVETSEVMGLRTMQGQDREGREVHHLIGVKHQSGCSILQMTGQTAMYWVDLLVLTMALFYADIAFDVKQLVLFYKQGLRDYLLINAIGMMAPPISTCCAAFAWLQHESREVQHFRRLVPSHALQVVVVLVLIFTQTHMIFLVLFSVVFRGKHPLLDAAKAAEVAESLTSSAVQGSFMLSYMAGLDFISDLDLTSKQLQSMAISIAISCASLGLNFASRDKKDRAILGLPGKVGWGPVMGALVMVRAMEVASRLAAFNIIHLSWRSRSLAIGHLGGPAAAAVMCVAAKLSFAKAELPDALAAVVAHPGQILEPRSLLRIWRSIVLHSVLSAAALFSQWQLRCDQAWLPDGAKVLPDYFIAAWLATTAGALLGLSILSLAGWYLEQPIFAELGGKARCIPYSAISTTFSSWKAAPLAAMPKDFVVDLTTEAAIVNLDEEAVQELVKAQCALAISKILPSRFWKQLAGASIRTAVFDWRFHYQFDGAEDLLQVLAESEALEELNLNDCRLIPGSAWAKLHSAQWPKMRKVDFSGCFDWRGCDDAEKLLQVLARCQALEVVQFHGMSSMSIPDSAWHQLPDGCWPKLRECYGGPEDQLQRLRGQGPMDADAADGIAAGVPAGTVEARDSGWNASCFLHQGNSCHLLAYPSRSTVAHLSDVDTPAAASEVLPLLAALRHCPLEELRVVECSLTATGWAQFRGAQWTNLKIAHFEKCFYGFRGGAGAEDLLEVLARCESLEELNLGGCEKIPGPAWAKVRGAQWPKLRKARFHQCFNLQGDGAEDLLEALGRCKVLEELGFGSCGWIPSPAWAQLQGVQWPKLWKADFSWCFHQTDAAGGEDLLQALARCKALEYLNWWHCQSIPVSAWQQLPDGCWPKFRGSDCGVPIDQLPRLRGQGPSAP